MREAASVGAAMGRLDRLGHLPMRLEDGGALGGLTGDPLAGLVFETPATGMLEAALASLAPGEAVAAGEDVPSMRPVTTARAPAPAPAVAPGSTGREASGLTSVPAPVRPPRRRSRAASSSVPRSAAATAADEPVIAPTLPSDAARVDVSAPGAVPVRSPEARAGAATPVGVPAPAARTTFSVSPPAAAGAAAPPPPQAVARTGAPAVPAWPDPVPRSASPAATSHPGAQPVVTPRHDVVPASAAVPRPGGELVPVAGLAGLVSWWESRGETPSDEAGIVPATTPPAAAWSVADTPHEAPRTAEGAFESSPAVRLSLRTALEELLLAEARASGIEVDP